MTEKIPKEKVAAITAAVTAYMTGQAKPAAVALPAAHAPSPWAMAGRQEAMQIRLMMQRRTMR